MSKRRMPFDQPDPTQGSAADSSSSSSSSSSSPLQRLLAVPEWEHKELIHSVAQLAPSLIATVLEKHAQRKESRSLKRLPKDVLGCVVEYLVRPGEAGVEDVALLAGVSKRFRACVQVSRLMGGLKIRTFERFGKLSDDKQKCAALEALLRQASLLYSGVGAIDLGIIITRGSSLDNSFFRGLGKVLNKDGTEGQGDVYKKYGASTTWMGKLLYRLDAGRNGGCPVLAIGITPSCVTQN